MNMDEEMVRGPAERRQGRKGKGRREGNEESKKNM